jgi:hypothetical protein
MDADNYTPKSHRRNGVFPVFCGVRKNPNEALPNHSPANTMKDASDPTEPPLRVH